ncbi:hypothetical protein JTB14_018129 [Gonioctena quinquepunctata]|nr:hypothetical protein JTB14_018129 [Gonioctena quinquepunctata]
MKKIALLSSTRGMGARVIETDDGNEELREAETQTQEEDSEEQMVSYNEVKSITISPPPGFRENDSFIDQKQETGTPEAEDERTEEIVLCDKFSVSPVIEANISRKSPDSITEQEGENNSDSQTEPKETSFPRNNLDSGAKPEGNILTNNSDPSSSARTHPNSSSAPKNESPTRAKPDPINEPKKISPPRNDFDSIEPRRCKKAPETIIGARPLFGQLDINSEFKKAMTNRQNSIKAKRSREVSENVSRSNGVEPRMKVEKTESETMEDADENSSIATQFKKTEVAEVQRFYPRKTKR